MGKHGPNTLENYQKVHGKRIRQALDGGFPVSDGLEFEALGHSEIAIKGELECVDGLTIDVLKILRILSGSGLTARVQAESYSYNASLRGIGNIFRYDSPHDHYPRHHAHRYDVLNGDNRGAVTDTNGEENRPTLGEVIDELQEWYYDNFDAIKAALSKRR